MNGKRARGRPQSATLENDLIEAAIALLDEKRSFDAVSVEAVCAKAGASKASFYRRWPDRDRFILALLDSLRQPPLPAGPTDSIRDDLVEILNGMFGVDLRRTRIVQSALVAEGLKNRGLMALVFHDLVAPRRKALLDRLRLGVTDGALAADTDVTALFELVTSPILKAIMLSDPDQPTPHRLAERVVEQALKGALPKGG